MFDVCVLFEQHYDIIFKTFYVLWLSFNVNNSIHPHILVTR